MLAIHFRAIVGCTKKNVYDLLWFMCHRIEIGCCCWFFCCSLVLTLFVEFGDSYVRYVFSAVLQVKLIQLCISCAHTHTLTHLVILNTVASLSSTNRPKMFVSNGKKKYW